MLLQYRVIWVVFQFFRLQSGSIQSLVDAM